MEGKVLEIYKKKEINDGNIDRKLIIFCLPLPTYITLQTIKTLKISCRERKTCPPIVYTFPLFGLITVKNNYLPTLF